MSKKIATKILFRRVVCEFTQDNWIPRNLHLKLRVVAVGDNHNSVRHGTCILNCLESPKRDFAVGIRLRCVIISEGRVKIIRIGFLDVIDYVIIRIRPASRKRHHRPEALQEDTQAS